MKLLDQYRKMLSLKEESDYTIRQIKESEEYVNLEMNIKALQSDQKDLLSKVVNYDEALTDLEQEIIAEMESRGITGTNQVEIKYKKTTKVNPTYVQSIIEPDDFLRLVKISNKDWKEYTAENEHRKDELKTCIEYGKGKATGIIIKN